MPAKDIYHDNVCNALETIFQEEAGQLILEEPDFRLIVLTIDPDREDIMQWQPQITP